MKRREFDKLPEKQQKAYYDAIMLGEKVWDWLCDNPLRNKKEFPEYKKIKNSTGSDCPLCSYYAQYPQIIYSYVYTECTECILRNVCDDSVTGYLPYAQWYKNITKVNPDWEVSFKNATKIWKILFEEKLRIM